MVEVYLNLKFYEVSAVFYSESELIKERNTFVYLAHFDTQEKKERKVSALQFLTSGSESAPFLSEERKQERRTFLELGARSGRKLQTNEERLML